MHLWKRITATEEIESSVDSPPLDEENRGYSEGYFEVAILPPSDYKQVATIEALLLKNPNIKILARGGTTDGNSWLQIELSDSLQLIRYIKEMLPVKQVFANGNNNGNNITVSVN